MTIQTLIYDTNNWIRVKLSTDGDSLTINNFWSEVIYKSQSGYLQIFVSDGIDSRRKRRDIYPEYKAKRKPADRSIYDGINLFKNFLIHAPVNVLRCELPYVEADDVIASIIKHRDYLGIPKGPIDIISTDKDLTQLQNSSEGINTLANLPKNTRPEDVHLYKTLVGDSSDNIPGVPKFGPGAFLNLPEKIKEGLKKSLSQNIGLDKETEEWLTDNLTPKLKENFFECYYDGTMQMFWNLTGFMYLSPNELIFKSGDGNIQLVTKEMNELFII